MEFTILYLAFAVCLIVLVLSIPRMVVSHRRTKSFERLDRAEWQRYLETLRRGGLQHRDV